MSPILHFLITVLLTCFTWQTKATSGNSSPLIGKLLLQTDRKENLKDINHEISNDVAKRLNDSNIYYFKLVPSEPYNTSSRHNNTINRLNITSSANVDKANKNNEGLANLGNFQIKEDRLIEIIKNNLEQLLKSEFQTPRTLTSNIVESISNGEKLVTESQLKTLEKVGEKPDQLFSKIAHTSPTYDDLKHKLNDTLKKGNNESNFIHPANFNSSDVEPLLNKELKSNANHTGNKIPNDIIPSGRRFNSNGVQFNTSLNSNDAKRIPPLLGYEEINIPPKVYNYNNYPLNFCDGCKRFPVLQTVPLNTIIADNIRLTSLKHRNGQGNIVSQIIPGLYSRPYINGLFFQ